jgi:hypothetical protein
MGSCISLKITFTPAYVFIIWILTLQAKSWEVWLPCVENDVPWLLQDPAIHSRSHMSATGSYPSKKHPVHTLPSQISYIKLLTPRN